MFRFADDSKYSKAFSFLLFLVANFEQYLLVKAGFVLNLKTDITWTNERTLSSSLQYQLVMTNFNDSNQNESYWLVRRSCWRSS